MPLALGQVGDGHERGGGRTGARLAWEVGPEVHDARGLRSQRQAALGGAGAVGQHQARVGQRGADVAAARAGPLDVVAVDGEDDGRRRYGAADRVSRRDGVVRVDQVEGKAPAGEAERRGEHRRRPRPPRLVAPRAGRRQVAEVADLDAVEHRPAGLADRRPRPPRVSRAKRGQRR